MGNTFRQVRRRRSREKWVAVRRMFTFYKSRCKKREIVFELIVEQFEALITGKCHYCNKPPQRRIFKRSDGKTFKINAHGIDRVDNSIGYVFDNCVSCCTLCNAMKSNLPKQIFIDHSKRIVKHQLKPRPEAKKC